jgi:hypothetical protein
LIVDKTGSIKPLLLKEYNEADLYKKAGFKTPSDFKQQTSWTIEMSKTKTYHIHVFGKTSGRAGQENKYDFPPPIDNVLFFGSCILVNKTAANEPCNLTTKEWNEIYEELFGGFEDLGNDDDDDDDDEEDEEDEDVPKTKEGYAKDGFIVDDDDDEDDEEEDEDYEDEEEEKPRKKAKPVKKVKPAVKPAAFSKKSSKSLENTHVETVVQETVFQCTGELSEEEYL